MPAGTAQGIAVHAEYKGVAACLVEIDCRPRPSNRDGPRRRHRAAGHQGRLRRRRRPGGQPARPGGPDDGRDHGRHRAGPDLQPAPARRPLPRGQLGQLLLHPAVEHPARGGDHRHARDRPASRAAPASSASPARWRRSPAPTPGPPARCRRTSRSTTTTRSPSPPSRSSRRSPQSPTDGLDLTY